LSVTRRKITDLFGHLCVKTLSKLLDVARVNTSTQIGTEMNQVGAGHVRIQFQLTGEVPDLVSQGDAVPVHVQAQDRSGSASRAYFIHQKADRCCFARAVGAKESEHFTGGNAQVQISERGKVTVVFS
jgi:hypothetical protein